MNGLRIVTWGLSAALHASLPLMLLFAPDNGSASLDAGSGNDQFTIERGIAIEGLSFTGDAMETVQAVDVPLVEQAVATPPVPQVEPVEQQAITTTDQAQAATVEARELEPPKEQMPEPLEARGGGSPAACATTGRGRDAAGLCPGTDRRFGDAARQVSG